MNLALIRIVCVTCVTCVMGGGGPVLHGRD